MSAIRTVGLKLAHGGWPIIGKTMMETRTVEASGYGCPTAVGRLFAE